MTTLAEIIDAVEARCRSIRTANGYNTDAGLNVFRGREALDEQDPTPALSIVYDGSDAGHVLVGETRRDMVSGIGVIGFVRPSPDNPLDDQLQLLADLKVALFSPGADLLTGALAVLGAQDVDDPALAALCANADGETATLCAFIDSATKLDELATSYRFVSDEVMPRQPGGTFAELVANAEITWQEDIPPGPTPPNGGTP